MFSLSNSFLLFTIMDWCHLYPIQVSCIQVHSKSGIPVEEKYSSPKQNSRLLIEACWKNSKVTWENFSWLKNWLVRWRLKTSRVSLNHSPVPTSRWYFLFPKRTWQTLPCLLVLAVVVILSSLPEMFSIQSVYPRVLQTKKKIKSFFYMTELRNNTL